MQNKKPILLVEDDLIDAMTVKRALKDINVKNKLVTVNDGEQALEYLHNQSTVKPCIILLDINMPKMNGIEFLKSARESHCITRIPVIILTTSKDEDDKVKSFNLGIAGYMIKPLNYSLFVKTLRAIYYYWSICELPD